MRFPGLAELKGASGFSPVAALGAGQVVFNLAPRINAAGRLGSPTLAHDMLLTPSHDEAAKLAQTLTSLNDERRSEEDRIYKEALEQAEANPKRLGFVLYGKDWHQGVIGIVASRIVEVYYRPVLILCSDGESLKGSGRSVPEFDLHAGLTRCADMLLGFGGHRQAAGLRIAPGRLDELRERFDAVIREELGEAPLTPSLKIDAEMPFSQASDFTVLKGLELLQPFGIGNPEPIFASLPLRVKKRKAFGHSREHISLEVTEEGSGITLQAKAWRQADQIPESIQGQRIRLAYTPGINAASPRSNCASGTGKCCSRGARVIRFSSGILFPILGGAAASGGLFHLLWRQSCRASVSLFWRSPCALARAFCPFRAMPPRPCPKSKSKPAWATSSLN